MCQERLADALAALRGTDEQVFQIKPRAAAEGREIDEPGREAGRLAVPLGDLAKQPGMICKQRRLDQRFGCFHFVEQSFVFGKFANKRENQSRFTWARAANDEGHSIAHTATAALICGCGS